jgi:hypothetical protein
MLKRRETIVKRYVLRKRDTGRYVARSQAFVENATRSLIFSSVEEADFYRLQLNHDTDDLDPN